VRRFIVGTAGHIDHGKTALVRALTGIDADRLPEEKARGITIDLGFAHLENERARVGFVDVPGHERFVRNMLAGAGGIDAILLVVAADEGVMPQTREHFAIAGLLGIGAGLVALTKADRVSPEELALAEEDVRDLVAGSFLEGSPRIAVSSVTGRGVEELRSAIFALADARESRGARGPCRLPVDRAFTIAGFGPVVTGSLIAGQIGRDERVEVLPERLEARVRRIEVHGRDTERALAGERTSLNLAGVPLESLRRGQMVSSPGRIDPVSRALAQVRLLPGAPPLASGDEIAFHLFASETTARVRILESDGLEPGQSGLALLRLASPVAALVGDRFVLRRLSPAATIGGGMIRDLHSPRRLTRADLDAFREEDAAGRIRRRVEREPRGIPLSLLSRQESLSEENVRGLLAPALEDRSILELAGAGLVISARAIEALAARARAAVEDSVRGRAGALGASRAAVLERVLRGVEPRAAEALLARIAESGGIEVRGDELRLPGSSSLPGPEEGLAEEIVRRYDAAGLAPPSPPELARQLPAKEKIVEGLVAYLVKQGRLARLSGGFFVSARAVEDVVSRLRASGKRSVSVPEFKEMFGLTRKMAIPLLEHLDEKRVTRRRGDSREVL
jgi:selenocysteine-specific elongation factor